MANQTQNKRPPFASGGSPSKAGLFDMDRVWRIMDGAIDIHCHSGPEAYAARSATELQMSLRACEAGFGAVVYKCHSSPSARSAALIQELVNKWATEHGKGKTDIFGGVVLNTAVGGLNPEAVVVNARLDGKYVWLPTLDSVPDREWAGLSGGVELFDAEGRVVPKLKEIFDLISQTEMVLGLCHQKGREQLVLLDEARRAGVKRIELVHPTYSIYKMSIEEMKLAVEKGAYLGIYSFSLNPNFDADLVLRVIKEIGPERLVMGSDCGMFTGDSPVDGMRRLITWMLHSGVPDEAVARIAKSNARELLY
ncbi:MAG: hypothetical protein HYU75_11190 [Betaproteobacteria bacterium]|nr:hypothetical protein [Betaproteobacteria bacterium]